jgi:cephalosporin-C deacetylase-like acetyl esterase
VAGITESGQGEVRSTLRRLLGDIPAITFQRIERENVSSKLKNTRVERLTLRATNGETIRAILTGPVGEWRALPAVLYCHAHGNRYAIGASELIAGRPALIDPPYAEALARQDIVALCIDLPCFGERAGEQESALAKRHLWEGRTLFGVMLAELSAALDLLETIDGVDAARIGAFGLSMGATLAFWLGALEPRLKAVAHLCCFADLGALVATGAHDLHGPYMTVPGLLNHWRAGQIAGLIAPRPQLVCVGLQDPLTSPAAFDAAVADLRSAYRTAGSEQYLRLHAEPEQGHQESAAMRAAVLQFFRESL